jgi:hypothetical protein
VVEAIKQFVKGEPVALIGVFVAGFDVAVLVYPKIDRTWKETIIGVVTALSAFFARAFVTPVTK